MPDTESQLDPAQPGPEQSFEYLENFQVSRTCSDFRDGRKPNRDAVFVADQAYLEDVRCNGLSAPAAVGQELGSAALDLTLGVFADPQHPGMVLSSDPMRDALDLYLDDVKQHEAGHNYSPPRGHPEFIKRMQEWIFGNYEDVSDSLDRIASMQSAGSVNGLFTIARFIKAGMPEFPHAPQPNGQVFLCNDTWANHRPIFASAGFAPGAIHQTIPWLGLSPQPHYAHERTLEFILSESLCPEGSVVLLMDVDHNCSGFDALHCDSSLSLEQRELRAIQQLAGAIAVRQERSPIILIVDSAYLDLKRGILKDTALLRELMKHRVEFFSSVSFSKNLGLYGERLGLCSLVLRESNRKLADSLANGIAGEFIRPILTSGPRFAAEQALRVDLGAQSLGNLALSSNMKGQCRRLVERLRFYGCDKFDCWLDASGMFRLAHRVCEDGVKVMRDEHHIHGVLAENEYNGDKIKELRISIPQLGSDAAIDYLARSLASVA